MKRQLLIVRHAKADDGFASDFDRRLTSLGIADATRMGKFLAEQGFKPDYMVSSSAPRALYTAQLMAGQLGFAQDQIQDTRQLYDEGPKAYLNALGQIPASSQLAMIFGHNPDVSYFAEYITHHHIGSMSKGAVVIVDLGDIAWSEVSARMGKFAGYHIPKTFRD